MTTVQKQNLDFTTVSVNLCSGQAASNRPRVVDGHHVADDIEWVHKLTHEHLHRPMTHTYIYSLNVTRPTITSRN